MTLAWLTVSCQEVGDQYGYAVVHCDVSLRKPFSSFSQYIWPEIELHFTGHRLRCRSVFTSVSRIQKRRNEGDLLVATSSKCHRSTLLIYFTANIAQKVRQLFEVSRRTPVISSYLVHHFLRIHGGKERSSISLQCCELS